MGAENTLLGLWEKWGFLDIALAAFMALWRIWHQHNKNIFRAPEGEHKKDRKLRENDLKVRCSWIKNQYFESTYLNLLGRVLD